MKNVIYNIIVMRKDSIDIKCHKTIEYVQKLYGLRNELCDAQSKFYYDSDLTEKFSLQDEIFDELYEAEDKIVKFYEDLEKFFEDKFNSYWKMTLYKTQNHKNVYLIYPFRIIECNRYLCCLRTDVIDGINHYGINFTDNGFSFNEIVEKNTRIEMEEISKDDFFKIICGRVTDIHNNRIEKLQKNGNRKEVDN